MSARLGSHWLDSKHVQTFKQRFMCMGCGIGWFGLCLSGTRDSVVKALTDDKLRTCRNCGSSVKLDVIPSLDSAAAFGHIMVDEPAQKGVSPGLPIGFDAGTAIRAPLTSERLNEKHCRRKSEDKSQGEPRSSVMDAPPSSAVDGEPLSDAMSNEPPSDTKEAEPRTQEGDKPPPLIPIDQEISVMEELD